MEGMAAGLLPEKFEEVEEAGHLEHLGDVSVDAADEDVAAFTLGIFKNAEEDAQTAGTDIIQL